jgi:hypothetical protein
LDSDELSGASGVGGFLAIRLLAFVTASILPENAPTRYSTPACQAADRASACR